MKLGNGNDLQVGIGLALLALLVYANSLGNGFVWDDDLVILANPALKGTVGDIFSSIDTGRVTELTPYYRPLTLLTYLIEQHLHGFTPLWVRVINVLLHAANTFFVYRLGASLNINRYAAVIAGLIFAVHPLHSEAVDFNSSRNTLLATLFILTTYLAHQRSIRDTNVLWAYTGASLFFAGLLSKEIALFVLLVIGFIEVIHLRDNSFCSWRTVLLRLIPYSISLALYLLLRTHALSSAGVHLEMFTGLGARLLDNLYILPRYLLTIVWPVSGSAKYFMPDDLNLLALPLAIAWLFLVGIFIWLLTRGRTPVTTFGLVWMIAFWLPVSGLFPIPSAPLADRYLYVPAVGLWLILGDQLVSFIGSSRFLRRYASATIVVIALLLSIVTYRRNIVWGNDIYLFTRIIKQYPEQAFGYHNLGCAYLDKVKNIELAEKSFEQAFALDPFFPRLRTQMGFVRMQRGYYEQALEQYDHAVYLNPLDAEAQLNRGIALERLGRYSDALDSYRRFLATPGNELPEARREMSLKVFELSQKLDATIGGERKR